MTLGNNTRIVIIALLVLAVAVAVGLRPDRSGSTETEVSCTVPTALEPALESEAEQSSESEPAAREAEAGQPGSVSKSDVSISESVKAETPKPTEAAKPEKPAAAEPEKPSARKAALPKLIEVGSTTCTPCKLMAPILEELKSEYKGKLEIVIVDVNEDKGAAGKYGVRMIPTQIFYDSEGREVARHTGFIPKDDLLAKFVEKGIDL